MDGEEIKRRLLAADDVVYEDVPTPEWAAAGLPTMRIRGIDGCGRDRYDQLQTERRFPRDDQGRPLEGDWRGLRAALVSMALVDAGGAPIEFSEAEIELLGRKNGAALDRCFEAAQRLAGLLPESLETAEKN